MDMEDVEAIESDLRPRLGDVAVCSPTTGA